MAAKCRQLLSDSRGCSRRPLAFVLYLPLQGHRRARSQLRASACVNGVIMRGIRGAKLYGSRTKGLKISLCAAALALPTLVVVQAGGVGAAPAVTTAHGAQQRPMTATLAAQLSKNVDQHVIVIMKSQLAAARVGSRAAVLRAEVAAAYQAPLMSELREVHATHVKSYGLVDSFAATVSSGEETWLKADPAVAEVIPDVTIRAPQPATGATATGSSQSVWAVRRRHAAHCERDTRRVRHQRPGSARSGGPGAHEHRLLQPFGQDRALVGHHRCGCEGCLDSRRRRHGQRELHPWRRYVGVRSANRR